MAPTPEALFVRKVRDTRNGDERAQVIRSGSTSRLSLDRWLAFKEACVLELMIELSTTMPRNLAVHLAVLVYLRAAFIHLQAIINYDVEMKPFLRIVILAIVARSRELFGTLDDFDQRKATLTHDTIEVVAGAFPILGHDHNFMGSMNRERLFDLLYHLYFDKGTPQDVKVVKLCTAIWTSYSQYGDFRNEAASRAVGKYGPRVIAARCLESFEDDQYSEGSTFLACCQMLLFVHNAPAVRKAICEAGVHTAMLKRYWTWIRSDVHTSDDMAIFSRCVTKITASMLQNLQQEHALRSRMIEELVFRQDMVLLMGRCLSGPRTGFESVYESVEYLGKEIAETFASNPVCMRDHIQPAWELSMDCVRSLARAPIAPKAVVKSTRTIQTAPDPVALDYNRQSHLWHTVGMSLGFAEEEPEYDPNEEKSSVVSDKDEDEPPVDCSWFRCPLYRDDMVARTRKMLKCSRCKAAQYCGVDCQKADWKEGGHRQKCYKPRR